PAYASLFAGSRGRGAQWTRSRPRSSFAQEIGLRSRCNARPQRLGRDLVPEGHLPQSSAHRLLRILLPGRRRRHRIRARSLRATRYRAAASDQECRQSLGSRGSRRRPVPHALAAIALPRAVPVDASRRPRWNRRAHRETRSLRHLRLPNDNRELRVGDEVVTYVARNLEPYRGFRTFMRSLPAILSRHPKAHVVIIGGDEVSYGMRLPDGKTYREEILNELGDSLDLSRVHFLGRVPYPTFLTVLQISRVHVYLTYPFVLSWSMLEALSAGCLVVGSRTPPVEEVLRHRENG